MKRTAYKQLAKAWRAPGLAMKCIWVLVGYSRALQRLGKSIIVDGFVDQNERAQWCQIYFSKYRQGNMKSRQICRQSIFFLNFAQKRQFFLNFQLASVHKKVDDFERSKVVSRHSVFNVVLEVQKSAEWRQIVKSGITGNTEKPRFQLTSGACFPTVKTCYFFTNFGILVCHFRILVCHFRILVCHFCYEQPKTLQSKQMAHEASLFSVHCLSEIYLKKSTIKLKRVS